MATSIRLGSRVASNICSKSLMYNFYSQNLLVYLLTLKSRFLSNQVIKSKNPEITDTRNFIKSCFKKIRCFLMPHPGLKASTSLKFHGKLKGCIFFFLSTLVTFLTIFIKKRSGCSVQMPGREFRRRNIPGECVSSQGDKRSENYDQ
jgi:hypothetical protein